ncbi:MAG: YibE/F family protein, partial [Patescibacteria group bacterium]
MMKNFFLSRHFIAFLIWPLLFAGFYLVFRQIEQRLILESVANKIETTFAADIQPDEFFLGEVLSVEREERPTRNAVVINENVEAKFLTGPKAGQIISIQQDSTLVTFQPPPAIAVGEKAIIALIHGADGDQYFVADRYRLPAISVVAALFFTLVVGLGKKRGVGSILGLIFSLAVIAKLLIPGLIAGKSPVVQSLQAALIIAVVSLYLAHGFNRRTSIALAGTLVTLALSVGMAVLAVSVSRLFGMGSEEALYIQQLGPIGNL